jgi:Rrf2 family cysteine metabolism transcriptional repressor
MTISSKSRYAVRALVELAQREDQIAPEKAVPLAELAARRAMPLQCLEQLFAVLRRAGIVRSRRGAAGGYRLARPPADVTVLDVVAALDGLPTPADCTQGLCDSVEACGAASVWIEAQQASERVLARTTLAELLERERNARGQTWVYSI